MRVFILALDGLEYELVKKWRLTNLLQNYCDTFKIPREYFIVGVNRWAGNKVIASPYTPIIWTSFLTGRKPDDHGVKELREYFKIPEALRYSKTAHAIKRMINRV